MMTKAFTKDADEVEAEAQRQTRAILTKPRRNKVAKAHDDVADLERRLRNARAKQARVAEDVEFSVIKALGRAMLDIMRNHPEAVPTLDGLLDMAEMTIYDERRLLEAGCNFRPKEKN